MKRKHENFTIKAEKHMYIDPRITEQHNQKIIFEPFAYLR